MSSIRDPRHQRVLAREFDIRQGFVAPDLEPSIQPVVLVADLENKDTFGDAPYFRRCMRFVQATSDATHGAQVALVNPVGSPMLIVARRIFNICYDGAAAVKIGIGAAGTPDTNSGAGGYLNRRVAGSPLAVVSTYTTKALLVDNLPLSLIAAAELTPPAGLAAVLELNAVLVPGGEVLFVNSSEGSKTLTVTFVWDEIPLEP